MHAPRGGLRRSKVKCLAAKTATTASWPFQKQIDTGQSILQALRSSMLPSVKHFMLTLLHVRLLSSHLHLAAMPAKLSFLLSSDHTIDYRVIRPRTVPWHHSRMSSLGHPTSSFPSFPSFSPAIVEFGRGTGEMARLARMDQQPTQGE